MTRLASCAGALIQPLFAALLTLLVFFLPFGTASPQAPDHQPTLEIACAPERPVVHPGERLFVWARLTLSDGGPVQTPLHIAWHTSTGVISGGQTASWSIPLDISESLLPFSATAEVKVQGPSGGTADCKVQVYVSTELPDSVSRTRGLEYLSGRALLINEHEKPAGYGLYSYLLFETPPKDDLARQRYLKALESYLAILQRVEDLEHYRPRSQLNAMLLPVRKRFVVPTSLDQPKVRAKAAEAALSVYDYVRSETLLSEFKKAGGRGGPYLLAALPGGSGSVAVFMDLSNVRPDLVWDWMSSFSALAAQQAAWDDVAMRKLALNTRNAIAVLAKDMPDVLASLKQWVQLVQR